jgi:hypothetical protein
MRFPARYVVNDKSSICIYRLKERFSLQNDPFDVVFTMCIIGSRRYGRGSFEQRKAYNRW